VDAPYFAGRRYSGAVYNGSTMGVKLKRPLESCFRQIYGDKALHGGNRVARLMCAYAFLEQRECCSNQITLSPPQVYGSATTLLQQDLCLYPRRKKDDSGENAIKLLKLK